MADQELHNIYELISSPDAMCCCLMDSEHVSVAGWKDAHERVAKTWQDLSKDEILEILKFYELDETDVASDQCEFMRMYFGRFRDGSLACVFRNVDMYVAVDWEQVKEYPVQIIRLLELRGYEQGIELKSPMFEIFVEENCDRMSLELFENLTRQFDTKRVKSLAMDSKLVELPFIQKSLQTFTNIKELEIDICYLEDGTLGDLVPHIANLSNLRKLKFYCETTIRDDLIELSKVTPYLEELNVVSCTSVFAWPQALQNWKHLKRLRSSLGCAFATNYEYASSEQTQSFYKIVNSSSLESLELLFEDPTDFFEISSPLLKELSLLSSNLTSTIISQILHIDHLEKLSILVYDCKEVPYHPLIEEAANYLKRLTHLHLNHVGIQSLTNISKMISLKVVEFSEPKFSPSNLSILNEHPNLRSVIIRGLESNEKELGEILTNPNLKISLF